MRDIFYYTSIFEYPDKEACEYQHASHGWDYNFYQFDILSNCKTIMYKFRNHLFQAKNIIVPWVVRELNNCVTMSMLHYARIEQLYIYRLPLRQIIGCKKVFGGYCYTVKFIYLVDAPWLNVGVDSM